MVINVGSTLIHKIRSITQGKISLVYSLLRRSCMGLVLIGIIGCGSSTDDKEDLVIDSVTVLPSNEPLISLGQEVQLQAVAENAAGMEVSSGTVLWTTSDPSILAVTSNGLMTGMSGGTATVTASAGGKAGSVDFLVVDLTGTWVGAEAPDTVSYTLMHTGTSVDGVFGSRLGFPPITDVNTGILIGFLNFSRYSHVLKLTTENDCNLEISGDHFVQVLAGGEIILAPGSGTLISTNCSISGTIDFATLRRQ